MREGSGVFWPLVMVGLFILIMDLYVYRGIKFLYSDLDQAGKNVIKYIFWSVNIAFFLFTFYNASIIRECFQTGKNQEFLAYSFALLLLFLIPKLVYTIFFLFDDIVNWIKLLTASKDVSDLPGQKISRSNFLNQTGLLLAFVPFGAIIYGVLKGRFDFTVRREKVKLNNLPKSFEGFKIVQISDMHLGSFFENYDVVSKAVEKINALNPDIILFTGDIVNNFATETEGWDTVLKPLKAKYGKFSVLGNHDYGDYSKWPFEGRSKEENARLIREFHDKIGFKLMLNENQKIEIDGEYIRLAGVENWGMRGNLDKKYGDLHKALENTDPKEIQLLMSHDPSHWEGQVLPESNIDITFSGHTHGMQFGIRIPGFEWSLVKYIYPQWAGLYEQEGRYIYVNRGFGYVGFPGRVGVPPEITEMTLHQV